MAESTPEQIQYDKDLADLQKATGAERVRAKEQFDVKYPNGRPAGAVTGNTTGAGVAEAAAYGISEALLNDPVYGTELQNVFLLFKQKKIGEALEALYKTNYYKISPTVKQRLKLKTEQRTAYDGELDDYKLAQRKRLVGVKIDSAELDRILTDAYDKGLSNNQVDALINFSGKVTGFGGEILGDTTSLKSYANSFGVGNLFGKSYWDEASKNLFSGTTTLEDIQADIRAKAASAFPGYADQINNGVSVDSIASAYKGTMATILERDPDSITYDDRLLRSALQYVGPDGKPAVKPLWQFEKELRSTPEWEYTNNARDTIDSLSLKVLRDWGLA